MDAVEKVARAIADLEGVEYDAAYDHATRMYYRGKARELIAAFPQLALEGREEWAQRFGNTTIPRDADDPAFTHQRTVWESKWSVVEDASVQS